MRAARWWMVIGAWAALTACGGEEATEPDPLPETAAEPTAEDVPVAEDFAEEAEQEITEDNYESELAEIEGELAEE